MSDRGSDWQSLSPERRRELLKQLLDERRQRVLPASFGQERLWFVDQMGAGAAYNLVNLFQLRGDLGVPLLARSLDAICERHETLRTTFSSDEGSRSGTTGGLLRQVIEPASPRPLPVIDLSRLPERRRVAAVEIIATDQARTPFDLALGPLLRTLLLRLDGGEHVLLVNQHHIITDGASNGLFFGELVEHYRALRLGRAARLPVLQVQYGDYARQQRRWATTPDYQRQLTYWRRQLGGAGDNRSLPELELSTDRPRPAAQTFRGAVQELALNPVLSASVVRLARRQGVTLHMLLLGTFQALLARLAGQNEVVVGSPIAGRNHLDLENLIGFFVNNLVVRTDLSGNPSFEDVLLRIKGTLVAAYDNQDVPFEKLVEELAPSRDQSQNPLFQVVFGIAHRATVEPALLPDLEIRSYEGVQIGDTKTSRFDLQLNLFAGSREIHGRLIYNPDLFDATTARHLTARYVALLEGATAEPWKPIAELPQLGAAESHQLLVEWNDTASRYPRRRTLHELFALQAARTPDAVALEFRDQPLTFGELERRANQLARFLIRKGAGPEVRVGISIERSLEMVIGLLGILKSGAAYVPLDTEYPPARLAAMIEETRAPVVITRRRLLPALPESAPAASGCAVVCLEQAGVEVEREVGKRPAVEVAPDHLAYVIYTSGSTGRPKGAMNSHRAIVNRLFWMQEAYALDAGDRVLQKTPFSFDVSVWEFFWPLITGARLVVARPGGHRDPAYLARTIASRRVTTLHFVPPMLRAFLEAPGLEEIKGLKRVICSGEALPPDVRDAFVSRLDAQLHNLYGPTAAAGDGSAWRCDRDPRGAAVPIGRPIANTVVYVLDAAMRPVPAGVAGELLIGGVQLARGYLGRPAMTADRFVPDPYSDGGRLYRTGDLVRFRPGGGIEFLGRSDHQVKIRGYRIELGEIEATLSAYRGVAETVVLSREDISGEKALVAYVVRSDEDSNVASSALRAWLGERLPSYMVPSAFVVLDELPLNLNGKIDRRALPAPSGERSAGATFVSPRSDIEWQIAAVWREVLGVDRVGVRDNFFDLGGHSLRLLQVQAKLRQRLGREVRVADLFRDPTVETLAARLADEDTPGRSLQRAAKARLGAESGAGGDEIAVVGMAGRFPGALDLETFWQNIRDGVESIRVLTDDELRASGVEETQLSQPNYVKARAVLDGVDLFDAWFFGYNPREAELIDPQHRLFLECAWQALELSGCDPARYDGLIGVWAGADVNRYLENVRSHPEIEAEAGPLQVLLACGTDYLPTRVSYKLNLKGPSVNVQTACSTSLVAIHEACEALREHRCDMALAGGVSVSVPFVGGYLHLPGGILSPDGHCRPFDAQANGTLGANGVGIVVLKRLAEAQRDGDRICALIRGTATNNDGARKVGFTAPSVDGQAEVIALAQAAAGVEPETITYVEAHGTATALGDPVEVAALQRVFGEATDLRQFCALGSLKSNIGHLSSAAGVGGLIKVALALQHRELPPSLHYEQPNPEIDFEHSAFFVSSELKRWPSAAGTPRRAGVSSFGLGGTNAHAVLEEAPPTVPSEESSRPGQLLVLSAKTPAALARAAENLAEHLEQRAEEDSSLADVAWTLQTGRSELEFRRAVVAAEVAGACAALRGERTRASSIGRAASGRHDVAFLFPGQGAQYVGMGRELFEREPRFREAVDCCCDLLAAELDADLREVLYPTEGATEETSDRLRRTRWAQPALFVVEYALAEQWRSWGVEPSAFAGHSIGELVAACLSGVLRLEDALRLVALRGRLMEGMPAGVMTAVPLSAADVEARLAGATGLWLSAVNGPSLCVVSGTEERLAAWELKCASEGIECRRQHTSHAFHSALMEDAVAPFVDAVRGMAIGAPRVPYLSNVTGTWITAEDVRDPGYWGRHIRQPVRFSDALDLLLAEERRVLLEVGPGQVLSTLARQQPRWSRRRLAAPSLRRPYEEVPDVAFLLGALGRLWTGGVSVPWRKVHAGERRLRVELPTYPFERQRFWLERRRLPELAAPRSLARRPAIDDWFSVLLWRQTAGPPAPAPRVEDNQADAGRWLVVGADSSGGEAALRALRGAGADVDALTELPAAGPATPLAERFPVRIVLASGGDAAGRPVALLELARELAALTDGTDREVVILCSGLYAVAGDETRDPGAAALDAMARVMAQEQPDVRCRTIDVGPGVSDRALAAELLADERRPVALRARRRWVPIFEPVRLAASAEALAEDGKVYLITGGLGRIGLALAESLARDARATLVLSSRSPLERSDEGDPRNRRVRAIEALGSEVVALPADVSDPAQARGLIREVDARCGRLDGVIHAAGLTAGSSLRAVATIDAATCDAQLGPKLRGLVALDDALRGRRLDFRVATSSISTVLGGLELGAYAAANAAMEAVAVASPDGWRTIALDGWAFEAEGSASVAAARSEALRLAMTLEEGVEATRRAIAADGLAHLIVSTADLEARIERWVTAAGDAAATPPPGDGYARPELVTEYVAPETPTQRALVEYWQEVLGIERIGVDDDFFELGGHSLLATQAVSRMRERFDIALSVRAVFQHPTVAELAEEIERIRWAAGDSRAQTTAGSDLVAGTL